jgi:glutamate-ammonia-ligase adenylyltransferase
VSATPHRSDGRRAKELEAIASRWGQRAADRIADLAQRAVDPEAILSAFDRVSDGLRPGPAERLLDPLAALFEASDFLPRLLSARPGLLAWLAGCRTLTREKSFQHFAREASAAVRGTVDKPQQYRRLRRYKYRELLRLMMRDVVGAVSMEQLGRETADLGIVLVRAALAASERALVDRYGTPNPPGFSVLGLGKLGGGDLNFSSDIDLVYVYRADGQTTGGSSGQLLNVQFFTKLGEALTQALSANTPEGFCFRVDLNLRPQGRSGAIVLSLPSMVAYYEAFGRAWERAALLKARVIAGDEALGAELLDSLEPFVWRRGQDLAVVNELRDLKAQIDLRGKASADDVKLGPGGIREVEFFVNALQLLHGGRKPVLREANTLRALRKLEQEGLMASPDADALEEAYLVLRRIENRLQMLDERQTHVLPSGERERARLSRSLGFPGWAQLDSELSRHRQFVQEAFAVLLGRTASEEVPSEPRLSLALDLEASPLERRQALEALGFALPDRALAALGRLAKVRESLFEPGPAGPSLHAVKLLAEVARTPDPDQALVHFSEFIDRLSAPHSYLTFLSGAPQVTRRLLNLFGQSDFLSRYFLGHPELLDLLVQTGFGEVHKDAEQIRRELSMRLQRQSDPEGQLSVLRRFKNEEVLRLGSHDISGELSVAEVSLQLSALAEAILDEALLLAENEQRERYGEPRGGNRLQTLAVIGLGKLGGQELGYQSDLDLLFVYGGAGDEETSGGKRGRITHHEYFAKLAQRLLNQMTMKLREGSLYAIDARLRPSGNKGTLVVSQQAFLEHHRRRAQLWERQALIKARGVAGDAELLEGLQSQVIRPLVFERPLPEGAATEIHRIRLRMEREIARESVEQLNLKTGHGGLVDVEFATQYLQLVHGTRSSAVRAPNTLQALAALGAEGLLSRSDAELLTEAYIFLRRVENRLRLLHGFSLAHLPTSGRPLALLARRLGYLGSDPGSRFLADYRAYTDRVREVYARTLHLTSE